LAILEPQLATDEPAFDSVFAAVTQRTPIEFDYRTASSAQLRIRHLEPWGIVSWHGHWYVVGHDRDRDDARMFRVSRIDGESRPIGPAGSYAPPDDLDLRALAQTLAPPHPHSSATVRVRRGAGDALRRRAVRSHQVDDQWTEIELAYGSGTSLADELASFGPDVVAIAPDEVRDAVVRRLSLVAGAGP